MPCSEHLYFLYYIFNQHNSISCVLHNENTISSPKGKRTLFSAQMQGLFFIFFKSDTITSLIKAHMTAEPTMASIDCLNKDTSVWWCATQLSSQVGRDNGTRAACPCRTCDATENIRDCAATTVHHIQFAVTPKIFQDQQIRGRDGFSGASVCLPICGSISPW